MNKKPLEGRNVSSSHLDELAASGHKDRDSFIKISTKTSTETFKVVVIDYYATGEGRHVFIKTGTEESIKKDVGDWLFQGADVYTVEQWREIDKVQVQSNGKYHPSNIDVLKTFAPILWESMNKGSPLIANVEYHWNES